MIKVGVCVTHKSNKEIQMIVSDVQTKPIKSPFLGMPEKPTGKVKCSWIDKEGKKHEEIFNAAELELCE